MNEEKKGIKLEQFKQDVSDDYELTEKQREDQGKDIRFIGVTGGMWEDYLEKTHGEDSDRARLEFDMTSERLFKFVGEWTKNRAGVIYQPDDMATSDDDAKLLTGIYRGDFRENGGKPAQDNAIFEAAACGMGAMHISEKWVDEEDAENENQEIIFKTVHCAYDQVMFDSNAKEANKSDARWVTKLTGYTPKAFEAKYPGTAKASAYVPANQYGNNFDWYSQELIYIAERWEIEKNREDVSVYQNVKLNKIKAYPKADVTDDVKAELKAFGWEFARDRKITRQIVMKSIFTGQEFIQEPKRIYGKFLPIVPFYAYRVFIDGKEHTWGLIRKLMDGNRALNTMISKLTETSAASADSINIYLEDQVEGHESELADNTNKAYQVVNPAYDENGTLIAAGPVGRIDPPAVDQSAMTAIGIITNHMLQKSGENQDSKNPDLSGVALKAVFARENSTTQVISNHIIESLGQVGRVYRSKAGDIYTRSMMKKSISADGTLTNVELNKVFLDPQTANAININDLSQGRFSTTVDVGPMYETQQEATVDSIERLLEKLPPNSPLQSAAISMWISNQQGIGLEPLKKLNRRNMIQQGLIDPETDDEKQELQQSQQQKDPNADLMAAATKQAEGEANLANARADGQQAKTAKEMAEVGKTQAETEKVKADTAEIVVDINSKMKEGAAADSFNRFTKNAQIKPTRMRFNAQTGGLDNVN
jgi:hypothetical protein